MTEPPKVGPRLRLVQSESAIQHRFGKIRQLTIRPDPYAPHQAWIRLSMMVSRETARKIDEILEADDVGKTNGK